MQSLVQIVDTLMVGRLGPEEIAAIGLGNTLRLFVFILVLSVAAGSMSLVAQAKGARDLNRISIITRQSISSGVLVSIILGILGITFGKQMLNLMEQGGNQEVVNMAYDYLIILFIGTPFLLLNFVVDRVMQGAGDMRTPLYLNLVTISLNILLNYIFIFGMGFIPAFGLIGAAIGTVLARVCSLCVGMYILYSGKNVVKILPGTYWPEWKMYRDIFNIGLPSGIQGIFRRGANIFLIGLITATELGTFGAAALAIGWQIEQLIIQPIVGLNVASTSLIGQALGRWQVRDAITKGNILIIVGAGLSIIFILPVLVYPVEVIRLFDPSVQPMVLRGAEGFFRITMYSIPVAAVSVVITGIMRGAGDTKPAMYSTLIFRNLVTIPLAYFLAFTIALGSYGIWYAMLIGRILDCLSMLFIWFRKKWLNTSIGLSEVFRTHLHKLSEADLERYLREIRAPLMAAKGTHEVILKDRVRYESRNEKSTILFSGSSFRVLND